MKGILAVEGDPGRLRSDTYPTPVGLRPPWLIAEIKLPAAEAQRTVAGKLKGSSTSSQAVGTIVVREWRGQQIQVWVLNSGFEWNGVVYRSLSAVAHAVTGAHWNGKLFFGLKSRKKAE